LLLLLWIGLIDYLFAGPVNLEEKLNDTDVARHVDEKFIKDIQIISNNGHNNFLAFPFV